MNAEELRTDMELVDSSVDGEINAQWSEGCHFWYGIVQWGEDDKRSYTWSYVCCDENNFCGSNEYESHDTIDDLFNANESKGFNWVRCQPFPEVKDK